MKIFLNVQNKNIILFILLVLFGSLTFIYEHNSIVVSLMIVLLCISLWVFGLVPAYVTSLVLFCLVFYFKPDLFSKTLSGFSSSGFWLAFSGLVWGKAINQTGLSAKISSVVTLVFSRHYSSVIIGSILLGSALAFIMPSAMGRVMLLVPILIGIATHLGFSKNDRGYYGIVLAGVFATYLLGFTILPSNLPNMVLSSLSSHLYHLDLNYAQYILVHFPVLGGLKLLLLFIITMFMFYQAIPNVTSDDIYNDSEKLGQSTNRYFTAKEIKLSLYLLVALLLWCTDSYHHIPASFVSMAISVICLLPIVGVIDSNQFIKEVNVAPLFYIAGIIGLGIFVNESGLGQYIAYSLIDVLRSQYRPGIHGFLVINSLFAAIGLFTTLPGIPALVSPSLDLISPIVNESTAHLVMMLPIAFSTLLLPFQAPPVVVAMQLSGLKLGTVTKYCLLMATMTCVILYPIDYYWFQYVL